MIPSVTTCSEFETNFFSDDDLAFDLALVDITEVELNLIEELNMTQQTQYQSRAFKQASERNAG